MLLCCFVRWEIVPIQAQDPEGSGIQTLGCLKIIYLLNLNLHSKDTPPGASEVVDGPQTPEMGNEHRDAVCEF